jgi:hypothetical protein
MKKLIEIKARDIPISLRTRWIQSVPAPISSGHTWRRLGFHKISLVPQAFGEP